MMSLDGSFGLISLLIVVADIWAILNIARSSSENLKKLIWVAIVFVPVFGLVLWSLLGPRGDSAVDRARST